LDTGAMYRCVTLACLSHRLSLMDVDSVSKLAATLDIDLGDGRVFLNGQDVSEAIRTPLVTKSIRAIADNRSVRELMVAAQRKWSEGKDAVTEGRDQGTVAFPGADCKIFLTASPEERARRRVAQMIELGVDVSFEDVLSQQNARDEQDTSREEGGLKPAIDSITICTDGMTEAEVLTKLIKIVQEKRSSPNPISLSYRS
jgi:CMP/dCMP kinase